FKLKPEAKRRCTIALGEYELSKMDEIMDAVEILPDESKLPISRCASNFYEGLGYSELYMRSVIQFCKRFAGFNQLSPADQFLILKPFCVEILTIRYAFLFDFNSNRYSVICVSITQCIP